MVAGTFGFVLSFLTTLLTAVSIVNERLSGTFDQLQLTPASTLEILLGKLLPLGAVFAFDVVLMVLAAGFLMRVWPQGSALLFIAISAFYVVFSLSLGLIFSATSATAAEAVQKTVLLEHPDDPALGLRVPDPQHAAAAAVADRADPGDALHPRQPRDLPARRGRRWSCCPSSRSSCSSARSCSRWRCARSSAAA